MLTLYELEAWRSERCLFRALSLSVGPHQALRLAGPNGSGKTTLMQLLLGLAQPDRGQIRWNGEDIRLFPDAFRRDVRFLGHRQGLSSVLSVFENLSFLLGLHGQRLTRAAAARALDEMQLDVALDAAVGQLSAGQQRRVALSRLCLEQPALWVLDEPFTALDRGSVQALEQRLSHLVQQGGSLVVTTHHELSLACPVRTLTLQVTS